MSGGGGSTSAEPNFALPAPNYWPAVELNICRYTVIADSHPEVDSVALLDFYDPAVGPDAPSSGAVLNAAAIVMAAVQQRLRAVGGAGAMLPPHHGRALWDANWQAHAAVVARTGQPKRAKEIRDGAAGEHEALSVCVGRRARRFSWSRKEDTRFLEHEFVLRSNAPYVFRKDDPPGYVPLVWLGYGDGCGLIFADTRLPKPLTRMPKRYCDRCAKKAGNNPRTAGLAKHALARLKRNEKEIRAREG
jgi:hypothetical protein